MRMRFLWKWSWHSWASQQGVVNDFCSSKSFKFIRKTAITCILSRSYDIFIHSRMLSLSRFSAVDFLHKNDDDDDDEEIRQWKDIFIHLLVIATTTNSYCCSTWHTEKKVFQYKKILSHHQIPQQSNNRNFSFTLVHFEWKWQQKTAKNMLAAVTTNIGIWLKKFMPLNCV